MIRLRGRNRQCRDHHGQDWEEIKQNDREQKGSSSVAKAASEQAG